MVPFVRFASNFIFAVLCRPQKCFPSSKSGFEFCNVVWNLLSIWFEINTIKQCFWDHKADPAQFKKFASFSNFETLVLFISLFPVIREVLFFSWSPSKTDWHSKASDLFQGATTTLRNCPSFMCCGMGSTVNRSRTCQILSAFRSSGRWESSWRTHDIVVTALLRDTWNVYILMVWEPVRWSWRTTKVLEVFPKRNPPLGVQVPIFVLV